jgi:hypothetical protein
MEKKFPLTQEELKAALKSRYWSAVGYGNVEYGLCPVGIVAQMRGAVFIVVGRGFVRQEGKKTDRIVCKALRDVAKAFGFANAQDYVAALYPEENGLKKTVLKELRQRGVAV